MATVTLYRANPAPPTRPESATGRAPPELPTLLVPACPNECFLDAQLHDLRAVQGRIQQISHRVQTRVASCQAGRLPIDVWLAPLLVRFGQDCVFQPHSAIDSDGIRPLIPTAFGR